MAESHGFEGIMGLGAETSNWGTEVVTTERFPFLQETLSSQYSHIADEALEGFGAMRAPLQGIQRVAGGFVGNWRYNTGQLLLQRFLGDLTAGTYAITDNIDDTGLTVAIERTVDVWTFPGFKPSQVEIGGDADGIVQIRAVNGIAKQLTLSSGTNTTGVLAALTNASRNILFQEMTFQIADHVNDIAAGDALSVTSFNLVMNRNLSAADVNAAAVLEPLEDGRRNVTMTFTLPRYQSNALVTFHRSHTPIQGRLYFTDGTNTKEILLPNGRITAINPTIGGAGLIPVEVETTWYSNIGPINTNTITYNMDEVLEELEIIET